MLRVRGKVRLERLNLPPEKDRVLVLLVVAECIAAFTAAVSSISSSGIAPKSMIRIAFIWLSGVLGVEGGSDGVHPTTNQLTKRGIDAFVVVNIKRFLFHDTGIRLRLQKSRVFTSCDRTSPVEQSISPD